MLSACAGTGLIGANGMGAAASGAWGAAASTTGAGSGADTGGCGGSATIPTATAGEGKGWLLTFKDYNISEMVIKNLFHMRFTVPLVTNFVSLPERLARLGQSRRGSLPSPAHLLFVC